MREIPLETPSDEAGRVVLKIRIGDRINVGDIIAEIETEKATAEVNSPEAFVLRGIRKTADGFILTVED
jgi:pyruvate/2-oxoglutarate dehydrogenase complex dihydrolipoamide acyltransferase (E2) component